MLVCTGMPVHVSACIFECTVSSNGPVCFWICLGITLVSLRRAGVGICLYVRICGGTVLGRPAPAKGLVLGEWGGGGVLTGSTGPTGFMEAASWGRENPSIQVSWRRRCWKWWPPWVGRSELHRWCPQADNRALAKWIGHPQGMECEVALKKWQLPEIVYYWENSPLILIKVKGSSSKEKRSHQMHTPSADRHPACWLWGPVPAGCSPSHQAEQGPAPPPEAAPLPPKNLILSGCQSPWVALIAVAR